MRKTIIVSTFLSFLLLSACNQNNRENVQPNIKADIENFIQNPNPAPVGATIFHEDVKPIAYYSITDGGLEEYNLLDSNDSILSIENIKGQLIQSIDSEAAPLAAYFTEQDKAIQKAVDDGLISPQAIPTNCNDLSFFSNSGCHFLAESKASDKFNAVYMSVRLPSKAKGEITVEESDNPECNRNFKTGVGEVPYIFLGGHSKGSLNPANLQQNMDAGLFWNCGYDNWALFTNLSGGGGKYAVPNWRLVSDQTVTLMFYIDEDNYPVVWAIGKWYNRSTNQTITGSLTIKCNSSSTCLGRKWDYTGLDNNLRLEVNLAQAPSANFRSGARFAGTNIRYLYIGNYRRTTNLWSRSYYWNVSASSTSSPLTGSQCIIPNGSGYTIYGTANYSATNGLNVSLQLPNR